MAEFPTPVWAKGLRSFFGLANYFRDHVRHNADDMERPMRDILTKHDRSKKFQWSELAERRFREMQVAIRDCAKLYFLNDDPDAQIILHLIMDTVHIYVRLMANVSIPYCSWVGASMVLSWVWKLRIKNTALEKFQYLLYKKHFILETDNKNLTFLDTVTSSRVYRWKLTIQQYAFKVRHVVGELNVVADVFSRYVLDNHNTKAYPI